MAARNYGQYCGVASALELVGERWALLIVRDLLVGPRRYTDLKAGLPRIPTNILATRLKELQEGGVIRRAPLLRYVVYELTDYGRGLEDVVLALGRWGFQAMGSPEPGDVVTSDSVTMSFRTAFQAGAAAAEPPATYVVHVGDIALALQVSGEGLDVSRHSDFEGPADLELATGPDIRQLISGELPAAALVASGTVQVLAGDPALLARFAATFTLARQAVTFSV